jgi:hypothetical protein
MRVVFDGMGILLYADACIQVLRSLLISPLGG